MDGLAKGKKEGRMEEQEGMDGWTQAAGWKEGQEGQMEGQKEER